MRLLLFLLPLPLLLPLLLLLLLLHLLLVLLLLRLLLMKPQKLKTEPWKPKMESQKLKIVPMLGPDLDTSN